MVIMVREGGYWKWHFLWKCSHEFEGGRALLENWAYMSIHLHVHVACTCTCMCVCVCVCVRESETCISSGTLSCFRSVSIVADGPSGPLPLSAYTQLHCIFVHTLCIIVQAQPNIEGGLRHTTSTYTYTCMYYTLVVCVQVMMHEQCPTPASYSMEGAYGFH
jgi:hypothetical protein